MSKKKSVEVSNSGGRPALKIGSRVRCTEDGVEGRITWANGVAVKVQWDDGERVTWRRDSLADRPIEILDPASEEGQAAAGAAPTDGEETASTASPREEPPPTLTAPEDTAAEPAQSVTETADPATEPATVEPVPALPERSEGQTTPASADTEVETPVPPKRRRKAPAAPKEKKLSALDAAAKVLAEAGQPLNCQEMIAAMAEKGYWKSPGGKTPAATLYSAILREITTKGTSSRFVKTERGKFAHTGTT
jgi:hypothetical protein